MSSRREVAVAGERLWFCGMTGQVAGEKKWSEARVQSHMAGTAQHVINTRVNTRHEFWLVAADGEERLVDFFDSRVAVREGQMVTVIWGAGAKSQSGPYLMLRNNNAQVNHWLISDATLLLKRMGLSDPLLKWGSIGVGVGALLVLAHAWWLALIAFLAGIVAGAQQRKSKATQVKQAAMEAMNLELNPGGTPVRDELPLGLPKRLDA